MPECYCPCCNRLIDAATPVVEDEQITPRPEDVTICFYCATFLVYKDDLTMREINSEEIGNLPSEIRQQLVKARKSIETLGTKN